MIEVLNKVKCVDFRAQFVWDNIFLIIAFFVIIFLSVMLFRSKEPLPLRIVGLFSIFISVALAIVTTVCTSIAPQRYTFEVEINSFEITSAEIKEYFYINDVLEWENGRIICTIKPKISSKEDYKTIKDFVDKLD